MKKIPRKFSKPRKRLLTPKSRGDRSFEETQNLRKSFMRRDRGLLRRERIKELQKRWTGWVKFEDIIAPVPDWERIPLLEIPFGDKIYFIKKRIIPIREKIEERLERIFPPMKKIEELRGKIIRKIPWRLKIWAWQLKLANEYRIRYLYRLSMMPNYIERIMGSEPVRQVSMFINDLDSLLEQTLTPEELMTFFSMIYDAMRTGRTEINLDWLPENKRTICEAWLRMNWGRYQPFNWFAVAATRVSVQYLALLYPNSLFNVYAHICWDFPDAPEKYRQKQKGDRVCIHIRIGLVRGIDLPDLMNPDVVNRLLERAMLNAGLLDYLEDARSVRLWLKPKD